MLLQEFTVRAPFLAALIHRQTPTSATFSRLHRRSVSKAAAVSQQYNELAAGQVLGDLWIPHRMLAIG